MSVFVVYTNYTPLVHFKNSGGILKYTCLGEEVYMRSKSCPKSLKSAASDIEPYGTPLPLVLILVHMVDPCMGSER